MHPQTPTPQVAVAGCANALPMQGHTIRDEGCLSHLRKAREQHDDERMGRKWEPPSPEPQGQAWAELLPLVLPGPGEPEDHPEQCRPSNNCKPERSRSGPKPLGVDLKTSLHKARQIDAKSMLHH